MMNYTIELWCDGDGHDGHGCERNFTENGHPTRTASQMRALAKSLGWTFDQKFALCPCCTFVRDQKNAQRGASDN